MSVAGRREIVIQQDNESGGLTYIAARDRHSMADRNGVSLAPYIHALYGLVRQAGAGRVLVIGCAGGTLATMLARRGADVTLVDVDPLSFVIARRYFRMPTTITCHVADGAAFLRASTQRYDALVLDAYADSHVPRHLIASRFFALARKRLARNGIFLINVIATGDEDRALDRIGFRLKRFFPHVTLLDQPGEPDRNALLVAQSCGKPRPSRKWRLPRLTLRPRTGAGEIAATLKAMEFRDLEP